MATRIPRRAVLFAAVAVGIGVGCGAGNASVQPSQGAPRDSEALAAELAALREEEKLARDVYRALGARWPLRVFANIYQAEQRHFEHIGALLAARGLADPTHDDEGEFTNSRFAELYAELLTEGSRSELDALVVGARIEELDIADLDVMRARTTEPDVVQVYELLRCGSSNHLRAFDRLLQQRGVTYQPRHLSAERYRAIAAGEHEACGRAFGGGGHGMGGARCGGQ